MKPKIYIFSLILSLLSNLASSQYYVETTKFSRDESNTFIVKNTRFQIDLDKSTVTVFQDGNSKAYRLIESIPEPDEYLQGGKKTTFTFLCTSSKGERCLFIFISYNYVDKPSVNSMCYVNYATREKIVYIK